MFHYIIRRLLLLPLTLFFIVLINFFIINLAPGDPASQLDISETGDATRQENASGSLSSERQYLQFREHYGLTLPVLLNTWVYLRFDDLKGQLILLDQRKQKKSQAMSFKDYHRLQVHVGDQARFSMPYLLHIASNATNPFSLRQLAIRFFIRGGTEMGIVGPSLNPDQRTENRRIALSNQNLNKNQLEDHDSPHAVKIKIQELKKWYEKNKQQRLFEPNFKQKVWIFLFETRFCRYMQRILTLDFGTIKSDDNKTVISEVSKRFKYSLTLAVLPLLCTFFLCLFFGSFMAKWQNTWKDLTLNVCFLILYAVPVFVVGPFLIEKVALKYRIPFTEVFLPLSGFTSSEEEYTWMTSLQRLLDVFLHLVLPLTSIMYGSLATQTRIARTAVLEVLRQNYVRTAYAKGVAPSVVMWKHVGRNAAITIVTSIAGSLGVIIGGSLIVETIFGINGFGKFFYEAIVNYDYNVIMFSVLSGSFLTLTGYLLADIAYTLLDPRVTLD